jgi:hypothetical protein
MQPHSDGGLEAAVRGRLDDIRCAAATSRPILIAVPSDDELARAANPEDELHGHGAVAWLLSERATGRAWRAGVSDPAWEIGGYDLARFELHVLVEDVVGTPDGRPSPVSGD